MVSKALAEHGYYKKKGVVRRVREKFVGEVEMVDSGEEARRRGKRVSVFVWGWGWGGRGVDSGEDARGEGNE